MDLGKRINVVIHKKKFVFMMLKKCASVSMGKVILTSLGHKNLKGHNINTVLRPLGGLSINEVEELDYTKVAWVRHPLDRLVSGWVHRVKGVSNKNTMTWYGIPNTISFPDFVDWVCSINDADMNAHFRQQTFDLVLDDKLVPNVLMKLETLHSDWKKLQAQFSWLANLTFHDHKTNKGNWQLSYDKELLKKASKRFSEDLNLLGYL